MDSAIWRSTLGRWLALALTFVVVTVGAAACRPGGEDAEAGSDAEAGEQAESQDGDGEAGDEEADEEEAVPIQSALLETGRIETVLRFSTNLEAESEVQVLSEATREIKQLFVEEGDVVRRGPDPDPARGRRAADRAGPHRQPDRQGAARAGAAGEPVPAAADQRAGVQRRDLRGRAARARRVGRAA